MNRPRAIGAVVLLLVLAGCGREVPPAPGVPAAPRVKVVRPVRRTIVRTVAQPGTIEAYERTSLYTRVTGIVKSWKVDIGDRVKKGDLLVELDAPDLVAEYEQKQAQVVLDREMLAQSQKLVAVAESTQKAAAEAVAVAKADVKRYQADVTFRNSEVARVRKLVDESAVQPELLDEKVNQQKASQSALDAAQLTVRSKEADRLTAEANLDRARTDVKVAAARVTVSAADERRLAALVGYLRVTAPYDGIVVLRNVNTGDLVRPASGDDSTGPAVVARGSARQTPLYVVARTDRLLLVVGVPEQDAAYVRKGTPVRIRVSTLDDAELEAQVSRTSWALNNQSRTLHAEIDLLHPDSRLLPGTYAYSTFRLERPGVLALPSPAITEMGNQTCCYLVEQGKVVRTRLQTGLSDGNWVEVRGKYVPAADSSSQGKSKPPAAGGNPRRLDGWVPLTGDEQVVADNLEGLSDGEAVEVEKDRVGKTP